MVLMCGSYEGNSTKKSMMCLRVSFWETKEFHWDKQWCISLHPPSLFLCKISYLVLAIPPAPSSKHVPLLWLWLLSMVLHVMCWCFLGGILELVLEVWLHNVKADINTGLVSWYFYFMVFQGIVVGFIFCLIKKKKSSSSLVHTHPRYGYLEH